MQRNIISVRQETIKASFASKYLVSTLVLADLQSHILLGSEGAGMASSKHLWRTTKSNDTCCFVRLRACVVVMWLDLCVCVWYGEDCWA